MIFKEDAKIKVKEVEKKIDIDKDRVIINKTVKVDKLKKTTNKSQQVGWLKPYIDKIDNEE